MTPKNVDINTLAKWLMANDFKPVVGHKFHFELLFKAFFSEMERKFVK
jgi:hypothetical protein